MGHKGERKERGKEREEGRKEGVKEREEERNKDWMTTNLSIASQLNSSICLSRSLSQTGHFEWEKSSQYQIEEGREWKGGGRLILKPINCFFLSIPISLFVPLEGFHD